MFSIFCCMWHISKSIPLRDFLSEGLSRLTHLLFTIFCCMWHIISIYTRTISFERFVKKLLYISHFRNDLCTQWLSFIDFFPSHFAIHIDRVGISIFCFDSRFLNPDKINSLTKQSKSYENVFIQGHFEKTNLPVSFNIEHKPSSNT